MRDMPARGAFAAKLDRQNAADGNFAAELQAGRVKLSKFNEPKYNASEAKGHETGFMGNGKPRASCIWSVYEVNGTTAKCQSINAWGATINETRELRQLNAYQAK